MKVVITGGAGYVGWSLVHQLLEEPCVTEILVIDNFRRGNYALLLAGHQTVPPKLKIVVEDLLNSWGLRQHLAGADVVCHLAAVARSPFSDDSPHEFDQVNHWGTAELCYAVEDLTIPRLVYLSSGAIYGFGNEPCTVDHEPHPITSYGLSKLAGERQALRLTPKHEVTLLRAATVYGLNPCARFDTAINKFCLHAAIRKPLHIHGSGEQRRAFIHVEALAQLLVLAVLARLPSGTHNAVDINVSISEIIEQLRAINPRIEYTFVNRQQRIGHLQMVEQGALNAIRVPPTPLAQAIELALGQLCHTAGCALC